MEKIKIKKKAQVWVETVIYILIGLAIIGILLGVINPKINQIKDKSVIDSMVDGLNEIDSKINEVKMAEGNKRILEMSLKKGQLIVDATVNQISFIIEDSKIEYSETDREIQRGNLIILTQKERGGTIVTLSLNYANFYLTYNGKPEKKTFNQASLPYKLAIENKGEKDIGDTNGDGINEKLINIDISSIS